MKEYQIFKKLTPFIWRRIIHAIVGLIVILGMIFLAVYMGNKYPDYEEALAVLYGALGVFIGWKIIRKGESKYRMSQIAIIVQMITGNEGDVLGTRAAMREVKARFKYARITSLIKNIIRHKNLKRVNRFIAVTISNKMPYTGSCDLAWILAHPEEEKVRSACRAISNFYVNRRRMAGKIIKAILKEIAFITFFFIVVYMLEIGIYLVIIKSVVNIEDVLVSLEDVEETLEIVWKMYFKEEQGIQWAALDVMVVISLYVAWFLNKFTVRSYQMIGIIREFLQAGEDNPPNDDLYDKVVEEREKFAKILKKESREKAEQKVEVEHG